MNKKKTDAPINIEKDLVWKDIQNEGYPKEGEKVIVHTQAIYTGHVEYDNSLPPKAKFVFDKQHILKDTRYSYISTHEMNKIQKEYW